MGIQKTVQRRGHRPAGPLLTRILILNAVFAVFLCVAGCTTQAQDGESIGQFSSKIDSIDNPRSAAWLKLDSDAKRDLAVILRRYPTVERAYFLKWYDDEISVHFVLNPVFDGAVPASLSVETAAAFAKVAPADKLLEFAVLAPEEQAQIVRQAKAKPFYVRP